MVGDGIGSWFVTDLHGGGERRAKHSQEEQVEQQSGYVLVQVIHVVIIVRNPQKIILGEAVRPAGWLVRQCTTRSKMDMGQEARDDGWYLSGDRKRILSRGN